jgi:diaminohydroxyphosphoribosylaminopyrimidine deaminase/5-amino-6-(5-phosphoribosylamino)uracil reductase
VNTHEKYIQRCIELAKNGLGTTYPNPLVGSIIVYDNKIIGEGWHYKAGQPHAEVLAIAAVEDQSLLKKATIYVSLEPCSHFGKTPPCCDLIIKHQIPNVVVGTVDPNEKVAGNGIKRLREAGANVMVGVLEEQCNELNKRFFTFHQKKRPYIILKWAESQDGFIAPKIKLEKKPVWITNANSRQLVHKWRSEEQAILVGTKTVIDDNPSLDVREWTGTNPIRIVLDPNNRIASDCSIYNGKVKTIVITKTKAISQIENCHIETINFETNVAQDICSILYQHEIQSVIIEGGSQSLQTFIDAMLWDEARIFKGNSLLREGTKAPTISYLNFQKQHILDDELLTIRNYD